MLPVRNTQCVQQVSLAMRIAKHDGKIERLPKILSCLRRILEMIAREPPHLIQSLDLSTTVADTRLQQASLPPGLEGLMESVKGLLIDPTCDAPGQRFVTEVA